MQPGFHGNNGSRIAGACVAETAPVCHELTMTYITVGLWRVEVSMKTRQYRDLKMAGKPCFIRHFSNPQAHAHETGDITALA
jgi:hypothetical protein